MPCKNFFLLGNGITFVLGNGMCDSGGGSDELSPLFRKRFHVEPGKHQKRTFASMNKYLFVTKGRSFIVEAKGFDVFPELTAIKFWISEGIRSTYYDDFFDLYLIDERNGEVSKIWTERGKLNNDTVASEWATQTAGFIITWSGSACSTQPLCEQYGQTPQNKPAMNRTLSEICIDANANQDDGTYLFNLKEEALTSSLPEREKQYAVEHIQGYIDKLREEEKRKRIKRSFNED